MEWGLLTKTLIFLINAIGIGLIFLVYFSNPKAKLNRIFVLMTLLMFVWVNFAFLARLAGRTEQSLLWIKTAWAMTPFFFVLIYFFVIYLIKEEKKYNYLDIFNFFLGTIFFFLTFFTDLVIKDIKFENGTLVIVYGRLVFLFFGAVFFLTVLSFVFLFKGYLRSSEKEEKKKIQYLLIGLSLFFLMNSIFNIFCPVFLRIVNLYEFGDYSTIVFLGFTAYAIVRRELFGIKIILTTLLVSLITLLFALDILVFTPQLLFKLYKALILVVFFYFGYLLIKSVLREIEYREKISKAYEVEKRAHKELKRLDEAKNQFIMATQHHLRTPLTSMIGYLDLIFGGTYGKVPTKLKKTLLKFQVSTRRLIKIVNEFLDITQFQLGKEVVSPKLNIDIGSVLEEIMEELQFEAKARGIYLKLQKPGKMPRIKADPEKLKIALFNIVDNGIKYTRQGGVTIKFKIEDLKLRIITQDTGMGISKEELKTLFTRTFERSKEAKRIYGTGRGIGLFIAGHIIGAHNGKIWAESEGKDKGSTFFIELPIK